MHPITWHNLFYGDFNKQEAPLDAALHTHHFIIGIGGNMKCGKTTAADMMADMLNQYLPEHYDFNHVQRRSWATRLKEVAMDMGWDGEKDERGRRLLQHLGTEVGREYDRDLWVKHLVKAINAGPGLITIIDDCRFPNEVEWVNRFGISVRIQRPIEGDVPFGANHASETLMSTCPWSMYIVNDGDLNDLKGQILIRLKAIVSLYPSAFTRLRPGNPFQQEALS